MAGLMAGCMSEQRRFQSIKDAVIDPGAYAFRSEAAQRVRHDESVKFRQTALLGFQLQQVGEGRCADRDRGNSHLFEEDRGVDTPRRAASSIAAPNQEEVGSVAQ